MEMNLIPQMDGDEYEDEYEDDCQIENTIRRINEAYTDADTHGSNESLKISKPPKALLDVRPLSYRPQLMTIGPLHDMLSDSASADRCKELCVWRFMQRHGIPDVKQLMQRIFEDPRSFLDTHYSNPLDYNSLEILQLMLTLDTILIYEFFLYMCATVSESTIEQYGHFQTLWKNDIIGKQFFRDLFLMGNQIPMSFLMCLIQEFTRDPKFKRDELNREFIGVIEVVDPFFTWNFEDENSEIPDFCKCTHLLDCLYVWVVRERPPKSQTQGTNRCRFPRQPNPLWIEQAAHKITTCTFPRLPNPFRTEQAESHKITIYRDRLPTASQLSKAGIWFRAIEGGISVMHYSKRSLRFDLPRLVVYNGTEDMLRNLIAHEQTSMERGKLTKYAVIMDSLIDTAEDVAILTKAQVIENHLGSDERLLKMWNDMCINISDEPCERWDGMIKDVLHHYHSPWRAYYVEFREKYFSRPWLTLSLLAASLLLLFTLVQTLFTVIAYYRSQP